MNYNFLSDFRAISRPDFLPLPSNPQDVGTLYTGDSLFYMNESQQQDFLNRAREIMSKDSMLIVEGPEFKTVCRHFVQGIMKSEDFSTNIMNRGYVQPYGLQHFKALFSNMNFNIQSIDIDHATLCIFIKKNEN